MKQFLLLIICAATSLPSQGFKFAPALESIEDQLAHRQLTATAVTELSQIISRDPQNYRAHIVLGNCCEYLGLPEQAIQQYKLAFKYGPDQPQAYLELLRALTKSGQLTAADSLLRQATERFPQDAHVLLWEGNALCRDGRYQEAESVYSQAMKQGNRPIPGLPTALARLRLKQRNYASALKLALIDLATGQNYPPANEVIGLTLMKTGQFEAAIPYLKIAFENESPNFALAFHFSQALAWCGKYNEALLPSLYSLAMAGNEQYKLLPEKLIDQIIPHLSKDAIQRAAYAINGNAVIRNNPYVHIQLAKIYLDKGLVDSAATELYMAVKIAPESPQAQFELALLLETCRHNCSLALKYLRQAHALAPNNYEISRHLMRLEDRLTSNKSDWSWQLKNRPNAPEMIPKAVQQY